MGLSFRGKKLDDGIASLAYEGVLIVSGLLAFYVLFSRLGARNYGVLVGLGGLSGIASLALAAWCQPWLLEAVMKRKRSLAECATRILQVSLIAALACTLVTFLLGVVLVPDAPVLVLIGGAVTDGLFNGVLLVFVGIVQLTSTYTRAAMVRTGISFVRPAVLIALLATNQVTLMKYTVVLAGSYVVMTIAVLRYLRSLVPRATTSVPLRTIASEGSQYGLVSLTWSLQEDFDKTLLNAFGFAGAAGTYAAGYKIVQMATLPIKAVVTASHHRFLNTDDSPRAHLRRAVSLSTLSLAYASVASLAVLFGSKYLKYVSSSFVAAAQPARWLAGIIILRSVVFYPFNALLAFSIPRTRVGILIGTSVLNLSLNVALIPIWSWKAAVLSTYVTEVAFGLACWITLLRAVRKSDMYQPKHSKRSQGRSAHTPTPRPSLAEKLERRAIPSTHGSADAVIAVEKDSSSPHTKTNTLMGETCVES